MADVDKLLLVADTYFKSDRLISRQLTKLLDKMHHLLGRMECAMCRWRHDIGTGDDVTYCSDLRGILCGRKNTSVPRLGALGKLKLDHLHIRPCGLLSE